MTAAADGRTVIEANVEDGPFLLSTVTEELNRLGLVVRDLLHPIIGVERDRDGRIVGVGAARGAARRETLLRVELDATLDGEARDVLAGRLRRVLSDALAATQDFPAMRERVVDVAARTGGSGRSRYPAQEVDEAVALLHWLVGDHFILLGARRYDLLQDAGTPAMVVREDSGLGILRAEEQSHWSEPVPLADVPEGLRHRLTDGPLLTVSRTRRAATVHRHAQMVCVTVKDLDDRGRIVGEDRFLGLFTQTALAESASTVPLLRSKLVAVLDAEDVVEHSHDERQMRTLFEALPKTELFQMDVEELRRTLLDLLEAGRRQAVRILWRADTSRGALSLLIAMPRERCSVALRTSIQQLLSDRLQTASIDHHVGFTRTDQAVLHFAVHADAADLPPVGSPPLDELETAIRALTRSWADELAAELARRRGRDGVRLAAVWQSRLGPGYRDSTDVDTAAEDIIELSALSEDSPVRMVLRVSGGSTRTPRLRFRLYKRGVGVELSGFLPILESLGFIVVEEVPHAFRAPDHSEVHLHDFGVRLDGQDLALEVDGPRVAAAATALWRGRAEVDSLNRLVVAARLPWEDVALLRAYRRYRRQVGTTFTEAYLNQALVAHPDAASALVAHFRARFDPELETSAQEREAARQAVVDACEQVERFDQDRILRGYLAMVDATLRTNRWAPPRDLGPDAAPEARALSLKVDPSGVPDMPKPVPHVEVFVYSPRMEGVHLRGGPIARGGIRWSDRQEDFRTEVLDLMKAQMTKNAVIVPTGSKGGFVVKQAGAELPDAVLDAYRTFIGALLDITDDVVGGEVVPPPGVRRADGDDPYLVVAADRGTAAFSDTANAISQAYGYWLGDAFASGGSSGYDHKAMGITARGAWVAVQRHFRELDVDVQTEPVTVVGIGDMSGDVFGNGMLRSRAIRLVAAFDHRDIFIDPDPDPEVSYRERERLFALSRSSWQDYDRSLLSPSGGVWPRTAKFVELDDVLRRLLRVDAARLTPPELIKALLRMPSDLLFAGGIGTYVKASQQSHAAVGDRANDAIRIDADEVGARVIGEGANLTLTQRARIQYARRGGRCNTDFIDNASGVATSDREVNIKILLRDAISAGRLDAGQRDGLLAGLTDDVAQGSLRDVYLQTWAISQEQALSPGGMEAYETLMADLEEVRAGAIPLDRAVEVLPDPASVRRRSEAGAGLTRPELAVLLAYAKTATVDSLLDSDLPELPGLRSAVIDYFPPRLLDRFGDLVDVHRLRRELVSTLVANDIVNRMGITYVSRTAHELGAPVHEVVAAYWMAREVSGADVRWRLIEALDGRCDPQLQLELKAEVDRLIDAIARAYLRQGVGTDIDAVIDRDGPALAVLEAALARLGSTDHRRRRKAAVERYLDLGIEEDLAVSVAGLDDLSMVPDVAAVARGTGHGVVEVAEVFLELGEALPLDRLWGHLQAIEPLGHWQRWQQRGLADELRHVRRTAAERALRGFAAGGSRDGARAVQRLLEGYSADRVDALVRRLQTEGPDSLDAVAVVVRTLREALRV